jgi:hypothetical protein
VLVLDLYEKARSSGHNSVRNHPQPSECPIAFPARLPASMFLGISAWSVNVECQGTAQGMPEPFLTGDVQEAPPLTDAKLATI